MNVPVIGHNSGFAARSADLLATGKRWFDEIIEIKDQKTADICSDYINQVRAFIKEVEKSRKEMKAPVLERGKQIDAEHKAFYTDLETIVSTLASRQTAYLQEVQRRQDEERRAAEEKARQEAIAAEEARKKAEEENSFDATKLAEEAERKAEAAAEQAEAAEQQKAQAKGDLAPRAMSLRTSYSARVTDYDLALEHYRNHPNVRATIDTIANGDARHHKGEIKIPGVEIITTQKAI